MWVLFIRNIGWALSSQQSNMNPKADRHLRRNRFDSSLNWIVLLPQEFQPHFPGFRGCRQGVVHFPCQAKVLPREGWLDRLPKWRGLCSATLIAGARGNTGHFQAQRLQPRNPATLHRLRRIQDNDRQCRTGRNCLLSGWFPKINFCHLPFESRGCVISRTDHLWYSGEIAQPMVKYHDAGLRGQ